ncbi:uncharacterized protein LOC6573405 [Drosophila mojavensis]|uniref:Uncharacterized protein, isoform A n=1 Tax=Drosophila mojavensis TaxID=7230 RepID=B4KDV0_DROMO|nr:uncharacterized protein LOC6573405 [Drosophila mojavensis]XP_015022397.1 uncharacterized protein LOC6573405 [Drosophila mojavensis]XP_043863403.1 uncharacterized protein LOC6573405 [Drosophila mojavensis]EDW14947.1 uncharacterized protein Dmoj_GI24537, isoform A [Drosophila mojavensis]KRG01291.1 uncharacterized protein Dmoj_GI24537, isoform B [Drosophila mojavensis]
MEASSHSNSDSRDDNKSLDSSFFETLWPLILDDNQCRVESESVEFFIPRIPFDYLHWHSMLAKVGFPLYEQPHDMRCCQAAKDEEDLEKLAETEANKATEELNEKAIADYQPSGSRGIVRIDNEIKHQCEAQEHRQRLAYSFANRAYPWTMQTPVQEISFLLTDEVRDEFFCPMERAILEGIYHYDCKLMIIDASTEVCADDFLRWTKFRRYVQMLCLVRCPRVQRHLQLLNVFHTLVIEENMRNSWHEELHCSLRTGLKEATRLELFKNCADAFVFIFSRYRGLCTCDTFKILRRT